MQHCSCWCHGILHTQRKHACRMCSYIWLHGAVATTSKYCWNVWPIIRFRREQDGFQWCKESIFCLRLVIGVLNISIWEKEASFIGNNYIDFQKKRAYTAETKTKYLRNGGNNIELVVFLIKDWEKFFLLFFFYLF